MSEARVAAARRLAAVLEAENRALSAGRYAEAGAMLVAKHTALAALLGDGPPQAPVATAEAGLAQEVMVLAEENRRLLTRALAVQGEMLRMIADAIPQAASRQGGRYGAKGTMARPPEAARAIRTRV